MADRQIQPFYARLSLATALTPVFYCLLLVTGGGSSGFTAWNDLVQLLWLMLVCAFAGLVLSTLSRRRGEASVVNVVAVVLHLILLGLVTTAFSQG